VLKSLFGSRAKFALRLEGLVPGKRKQTRWDVYRWNIIALLLAGVISWGVGNGLRGQTPGTTSPMAGDQSELSAKTQVLVQQGDDRLAHKDFAGAEAAFREAIEGDPTAAPAHHGLGFALWQQGHPAAAWKELRLAARLDPGSAGTHYLLGKLAWFLYQHPGGRSSTAQTLTPDDFRALALGEVEKAVALDPRNFEMCLDLAELYLDVGRDKPAQAQGEQAVQLAASPAERSLAHVTVARALISTGEEDRGEAEYQKALHDNPASGVAYLNLGQLRLIQHKPQEAATYFRRAIQVSPGLEPAYAALAELLANAHEHAEARALFEEAVALDPKDWHSRYELAVLLMEAGQSARAKDMLTEIMGEQEDFLPARKQLALLLLRQGDLEGARVQAQALIARDPQAEEGHQVMALLLWRDRQIESSLAECALALTANSHSVSMLLLQSLALWQEKRRQDSQAAFRAAAKVDSSVASAVTFCRLIACDGQDIPLVEEFLRKNRWVLNPPENQ
jgi:Tfp pilus assembly protein PilF